VYAGGAFTTADGTAANRIAKWTGTAWSAVSSGMNSIVYALAVSGTNVYAAGGFSTAGGTTANHIAKWNGTSWSAVGSGFNNLVYALAASGSSVYAGGFFTPVGGSTANYIAKWNGTTWSQLGSGMNGGVSALALAPGELYAGGTFTTAGGKASAYVAKAIVTDGFWWSIQHGVPGQNTNTLTFIGIPTCQYTILFATNLTTSPWLPFSTNVPDVYGFATVQDPSATATQRFYRLITP